MHRRKSLLRSLLILTVAGPIGLATAIAVIHSYQQSQMVADLTEMRLETTARAMSLVDQLPGTLADLQVGPDLEVQLLDSDGKILATTGRLPVGHAVASETDVYSARHFGRGVYRATSNGNHETSLTIKLDSQHAPVVYLRIKAPTFGGGPDGRGEFGPTWASGWYWSVTLGFGVLGSVLAYQLVRTMRRALRAATVAVEQLGALRWDQSLDVPGSREIEALADAFNRATEALSSEFTQLVSHRNQLEQTAVFLEKILGTMIEGIIVVDVRHNVLFANPAAMTLLNARYESQLATGRQLLELARHRLLDQGVRRVLAGEDRIQIEFELTNIGRTLALFATRLGSDTVTGAVLVLHDVTELRRLERLRREFVSNVSHELKTPLAAIQGYVETLLDGALEDPNARRRFTEGIALQSERLSAMVHDLLKLARIESGKEVFDIQTVVVADVIRSSLEANLHLAESKDLSLQLAEIDDELAVKADRSGIRTIVDNLVTNAIKYTPPGGRVLVRCGLDGSSVRIDVVDTGIGIGREHQSRIFERFYRVDEGRSREDGGTGLGLAIVKHLAQVFGGRVTLQSELGKGSCFSIFLPQLQESSG